MGRASVTRGWKDKTASRVATHLTGLVDIHRLEVAKVEIVVLRVLEVVAPVEINKSGRACQSTESDPRRRQDSQACSPWRERRAARPPSKRRRRTWLIHQHLVVCKQAESERDARIKLGRELGRLGASVVWPIQVRFVEVARRERIEGLRRELPDGSHCVDRRRTVGSHARRGPDRTPLARSALLSFICGSKCARASQISHVEKIKGICDRY